MPTDDSWPRDPQLDSFRDAVWELSLDGAVEAHLITQVTHFRYFPLGLKHHEWMWCSVCWVDGRRDIPEEDLGPEWYTVAEVESGKFETESGAVFDAAPLAGPERDRLWAQYGPP